MTGRIIIIASFGVYKMYGNYTPKEFQNEVKKFTDQIQASYNPNVKYKASNDITYSVETQISVKEYNSEQGAVKSGADNVVGLAKAVSFNINLNGQLSNVFGKTYQLSGENFDRIIIATKAPPNQADNLGGHEFGHGLGAGGHTDDTTTPGNLPTQGVMLTKNLSTTTLTAEDFTHIFIDSNGNILQDSLNSARRNSSSAAPNALPCDRVGSCSNSIDYHIRVPNEGYQTQFPIVPIPR